MIDVGGVISIRGWVWLIIALNATMLKNICLWIIRPLLRVLDKSCMLQIHETSMLVSLILHELLIWNGLKVIMS